MIISKKKFQEKIAEEKERERAKMIEENALSKRFELIYRRIDELERIVYDLKDEIIKKKFTAVKNAVKGEFKCKNSMQSEI